MANNKWEEYLNKKADATRVGTTDEKKFADAVKDASTTDSKTEEILKQGLDQLGNNILQLGTRMIQGDEGLSVFNDSIGTAGSTISSLVKQIPIVGDLLASVVDVGTHFATMVNKQGDALFKTYQDISRSGLVTGMTPILNDLHSMGYTMKEVAEFGKILKSNSQLLAQFGDTAAGGTQQLVNVSKSIMSSGIGTQLKLMGMNTSDINQGVVNYMKTQSYSGSLQYNSVNDLRTSVVNYIEQQDRLTKMTGLNAEQQQSALEKAYKNMEFASVQADLKQSGQENLAKRNEDLVPLIEGLQGKGAADGFVAWISGNMTSTQAKQFQMGHPRLAAAIRSGETDISKLRQITIQDSKEILKSAELGKQGAFEQVYGPISQYIQAAGAAYDKANDDVGKIAKDEQDFQKQGGDKATKNMVDMTTNQRNQTMAFENLASKALPAFQSAATGFYEAANKLPKMAGQEDNVGGDRNLPPAHPVGPSGPSEQGVKPEVLSKKAQLESILGKKLVVTSGFRAGAANHGTGDAIDLGFGSNRLTESDKNKLLKSAIDLGFTGIGAEYHAPGGAHIHLDTSHGSLTGWGSDYTSKSLPVDSPYLASLIDAKRAGRPAPPMPHAAMGNVITGPTSGYKAMLHGTEAVVPMNKNKETIQVETNKSNDEEISLMHRKIELYNQLINGMNSYNRTYAGIISATH